MKQRCLNKSKHKYPQYGGRGITICERWLSFANFYGDMGRKPENRTLDRIDVNGNYEPTNCRWATVEQQMNNTTKSRRITCNGETKTLQQWANFVGSKRETIAYRLNAGWPIEKSLGVTI